MNKNDKFVQMHNLDLNNPVHVNEMARVYAELRDILTALIVREHGYNKEIFFTIDELKGARGCFAYAYDTHTNSIKAQVISEEDANYLLSGGKNN